MALAAVVLLEELLEELLDVLPGACGTAEKNAAMLIGLARFEERCLTYSKGLSIRILQTKNKKQKSKPTFS